MKRLLIKGALLTAALFTLTACSGGEVKYASPEAAAADFVQALTSGDVKAVCAHASKDDRPGCEDHYAEQVKHRATEVGDDLGIVKDSLSITYYNDDLDASIENISFGNGYGTGGIYMLKEAGTWRVSMAQTLPV